MSECILIGTAAGLVTGFLVSSLLRRLHWEAGYAIRERNGHRAGVADAQIILGGPLSNLQKGNRDGKD